MSSFFRVFLFHFISKFVNGRWCGSIPVLYILIIKRGQLEPVRPRVLCCGQRATIINLPTPAVNLCLVLVLEFIIDTLVLSFYRYSFCCYLYLDVKTIHVLPIIGFIGITFHSVDVFFSHMKNHVY